MDTFMCVFSMQVFKKNIEQYWTFSPVAHWFKKFNRRYHRLFLITHFNYSNNSFVTNCNKCIFYIPFCCNIYLAFNYSYWNIFASKCAGSICEEVQKTLFCKYFSKNWFDYLFKGVVYLRAWISGIFLTMDCEKTTHDIDTRFFLFN